MNSHYLDSGYIQSFFSERLNKPVNDYSGYMSTKALDEFSVQLVNYREKNELNQTELARLLGISQPMISQYESGTNNITIKRLCEICEKIGVRVDVKYESTDESIAESSHKDFSNPYILTDNGKNLIGVA